MRMREDHKRDGQPKPAYHARIAVNSAFVTGIDAFSRRTDFETLARFCEHYGSRGTDASGLVVPSEPAATTPAGRSVGAVARVRKIRKIHGKNAIYIFYGNM